MESKICDYVNGLRFRVSVGEKIARWVVRLYNPRVDRIVFEFKASFI